MKILHSIHFLLGLTALFCPLLSAEEVLPADVTIAVIASPKETVAKKDFSSPYILKASHADGTPAAGYPIQLQIPCGRGEDSAILYESRSLQTEADGTLSFLPDAPQQAFNSLITFTPGAEEAQESDKAVTAPFLVRSRLLAAGGSLALVDFTQSGSPIRTRSDSSSSLLISLMQKGFTRLGNADFTDQVAAGDREAVYKEAKSLFGSACAFLVYGTVKYGDAVKKTDTGYLCTLQADITCINMKDGSVLYHTLAEATASEKQEQKALLTARTALAKDLALQLYYGM